MVLNLNHRDLCPHLCKIQWSVDVLIFLMATLYFSFNLESIPVFCFVSIHSCWRAPHGLLLTFDPVHACYSPGQFWNLFEMPSVLKQLQSWWELQRRGRLGAGICSSNTLRFISHLRQMNPITGGLGQSPGHVYRYHHQKLCGLGSWVPNVVEAFNRLLFWLFFST